VRIITIVAVLVGTTLLLCSCGTAYYGMPPRTLEKDEGYLGIGVAWSSLEPWAAWHDVAVNGHVWWGTSDRDAVGLAFSHVDFPFFFPEVSYAHAWAPDEDGRRLVGSIHGSLAWRWNPVLEAGLGLSHDAGRFAQLAWAGAGLWKTGDLTPSLRYVAQNAELRGEVDWAPGRTATALRVARGDYFARSDPAGIELTGDQVVAFRRDSTAFDGARWIVELHGGGAVQISSSDPYVDFPFETWIRGFVEKFPPAADERLVWVYDRRGPRDAWRAFPVEVDMTAVVARFERDGVIRLKPDPDAPQRVIKRHGQWWRDLSVGLWWAWYDPAVLE
jgi:hypothetical protein